MSTRRLTRDSSIDPTHTAPTAKLSLILVPKPSRITRDAMHAIRLHEHDGPELLALREIERPEPGPNEVHIDTEAIGVNSVDDYFWASTRTPVHTGTRRSRDRQCSRLARQPVRHFFTACA